MASLTSKLFHMKNVTQTIIYHPETTNELSHKKINSVVSLTKKKVFLVESEFRKGVCADKGSVIFFAFLLQLVPSG